MFSSRPNTDVSLQGPLSISGNAAELAGGAFGVFGGRLNISGAVCATNNTAGQTGSFADVRGSSLNVESGAVVNVGDNTPANSTLNVDAYGEVRCGADSSPWASDKVYSVQGPLCACSAAFEAGTSTTCDSCGSRGWDADKCDCAVSCGDADATAAIACAAVWCA